MKTKLVAIGGCCLASLVAGCWGSIGAPEVVGATATTGSDGGSDDGGNLGFDASASATLPTPQLSIGGAVHASDGSALAAVTVCLYGGVDFAGASAGPLALTLSKPACTYSAADGSFLVSGAQAVQWVTLTFQKNGFAPTLRAIATQTADITLPSSENVLLPVPMTFMGTSADPSKGQIAFSATTPGAGSPAQMSVTATAFTILGGFTGPSEQPRYLGPDGAPAAGAAAGAAGGFVNVPSGLYLLQFEGTSARCAANTGLYGYPASPGAIFVPVLEGYVTAPVGVSCTGS